MLATFGVLACVVVPQASAKGPVSLCGSGGCAQVGTVESSVRWWGGAYDSHVKPVGPAPFYALTFGGYSEPVAYWVPSAGVLRVVSTSGPAIWVQPRADEIATLTQAAASLQPFAAPQSAKVAVDGRPVRHGQATYLRLFTMGNPVARAVGAKGWLPVDFRGSESPWSDAYAWIWVSRSSHYLKHPDGDIVSIPLQSARCIRARLALTG